jgi:aldehyde:ferredoxin oxidoreductase
MMGMNGYKNVILRVNLSTGRVNKEPLKPEWVDNLVGGKGLAYRCVLDDLPAGIDALGEGNEVCFMTGTLVPTSSRLVVVTKSPATGTVLETHAGGSIAGEIKYAGYDGIVVEGRSPKPVYLYVNDEDVQIRDASSLWGKGIYESACLVRQELDDERVKIIGIGPAGENLVKYACLVTDHYHAAGRGGAGAVMGSKNLKSLVVRGRGGVAVRDMAGLLAYLQEVRDEHVLDAHHEWTYHGGTPVVVDSSNSVGVLPTRNFQAGSFENASAINADAAMAIATPNRLGCLACPLSCGAYVRTSRGYTERAQYETVALAGSNCGIADLEAITEFSRLCNDLGLDTISAGNTIAFAMELTDKGVEDFGVRFGDSRGCLQMTRDIAYRRGIGDTLAEGVRSVADKHGGGEMAMEIKGLEFPGYDPRGSFSMALAYATSLRGACHDRAFPIADDAFGTLDPFTFEGKAQLVVDGHHYTSAKECLVVCALWAASLDVLSRVLSLATDLQLSSGELATVGERVWNLGRLFNIREGFTRHDDYLPQRVYSDRLLPGPPTDKMITRVAFEASLSEYYRLRGWDEQGTPEAATLERLGLSEFADIVQQGGGS